MAKIFQTIVKKIIGAAGAGGLTFRDTFRRIEGFVARVAVTEVPTKRSEVLMPNATVNDPSRRSDQYRIPSVAAAIIDALRRGDGVSVANVSITDVTAKRSDVAKVSFYYVNGATFSFTVPTGVTSLLVEGWGAGGNGGAAVVNGGGGGGGGGKGTLTLAVVPGDLITGSLASGSGLITSVSKNGTQVMQINSGSNGGAGSATAGGTGGAGSSATGAGVTSITGSSGTNGSLTAGGNGGAAANPAPAGLGGAGATGATATAAAGAAGVFGGGGGGATTAGAASSGARATVRLSFTI